MRLVHIDRDPMKGRSGRTYLVLGDSDIPKHPTPWMSEALVVSVFSPNCYPAQWPYPDFESRALYLGFWDVRPESESWQMPCISLDDAQCVANAVVIGRDMDRYLAFQCEAGVSRSAGLCVAVARYFGDDEVAAECFRRYAPNELVVERVSNALAATPYEEKGERA